MNFNIPISKFQSKFGSKENIPDRSQEVILVLFPLGGARAEAE